VNRAPAGFLNKRSPFAVFESFVSRRFETLSRQFCGEGVRFQRRETDRLGVHIYC